MGSRKELNYLLKLILYYPPPPLPPRGPPAAFRAIPARISLFKDKTNSRVHRFYRGIYRVVVGEL